MINKISFAGRETMLTKGVKEVASKATEYVGAGKVYTAKEIAKAEDLVRNAKINKPLKKDIYTSPFAPTQTSIGEVEKVRNNENGYLYNVAHGKPEEVASDSVAKLDLLA